MRAAASRRGKDPIETRASSRCPRCGRTRPDRDIIVSVGPVTVGTYDVYVPGVSPGPDTTRLLGVHRIPQPYGGFIEVPEFAPLPAGPGHKEVRHQVERRATDIAGDHHADFVDERAWIEGGPGCRDCRDRALAAHRQRTRENNDRRDRQLRELVSRRPAPLKLPPAAYDNISGPLVSWTFGLLLIAMVAYSLWRDIPQTQPGADLDTVLAENIQMLLWDASQFALSVAVPVAIVLLVPPLLYDMVVRPLRRVRRARYARKETMWREELAARLNSFREEARQHHEPWEPAQNAQATAQTATPRTYEPGAVSSAWDVCRVAVWWGVAVWLVGLASRHVLIGL